MHFVPKRAFSVAIQDLTETCKQLPTEELRAQADEELQRIEGAFCLLQARHDELLGRVAEVLNRAAAAAKEAIREAKTA